MRVNKRTTFNRHVAGTVRANRATTKSTFVKGTTKGKLYSKNTTQSTRTTHGGAGPGVKGYYTPPSTVSTKRNINTTHSINTTKVGLAAAGLGVAAYQANKFRKARATGKADPFSSANRKNVTAKTKTMGRVAKKR